MGNVLRELVLLMNNLTRIFHEERKTEHALRKCVKYLGTSINWHNENEAFA
jgi:hypothetical protein